MAIKNITRAVACVALFIFATISTQAQATYPPELQAKFINTPKVEKPVLKESIKQEPKQQDTFLRPKPYGKWFAITSVIYWGGTAADIASSQGKDFYEGNPRFRSADGGLNTGRAVTVAVGIYAATVALEKKFPFAMAVLRSIVGIGRGGVAWTNRN